MANAPAANTEQGGEVRPAKKQYIVYMKARDTFLADASDEEKKTMMGHFYHLASLHRSGALLLGSRYMAQPIAVCVVEAANEAEARKLMEEDPSVRAGIIKLEMHEIVMPFLEGRPAPKM